MMCNVAACLTSTDINLSCRWSLLLYLAGMLTNITSCYWVGEWVRYNLSLDT